MYGILAFQLMRSLVRQYSSWQLRYYATVIAFIISVMYGGLIEVYQHYLIADRFGDWIDFLANIIGTFLGVVASDSYLRSIFANYLIRWNLRKPKKPTWKEGEAHSCK